MKKFFSVFFALIVVSLSYAQVADSSKKVDRGKEIFKITIVPSVLIVGGLLVVDEDHWVNRYSIRAERNEDIPYFKHHVDDYLQYAPAAAVYILNACGVKGKNDMINRSMLLLKSELLMTSIVLPLKNISHTLRPDSSNYRSFPSGHTAQAFTAATFLHKEFGHKSIWYSIGGYTVATAIGLLRMANNKHWLSDVLVGAGIGILSTNMVYYTHRYRWGKRPALTVLPTYRNGPGFYVAYRFK